MKMIPVEIQNPTLDEREHHEAPARALVSSIPNARKEQQHGRPLSTTYYITWTWTWTTIKTIWFLRMVSTVWASKKTSHSLTTSPIVGWGRLLVSSLCPRMETLSHSWVEIIFFLFLIFNFEVRHQRPGPVAAVCCSVKPPRSSASTPFMNSLTATVDHSETNYWGESEGAEIEPAWIQIQQSGRPVAKLLLLGRTKNVWGI